MEIAGESDESATAAAVWAGIFGGDTGFEGASPTTKACLSI